MLILRFIYKDFINKKFNNLKNNRNWIGIGAALRVLLGAVAQLVEHFAGSEKVRSSILLSSTKNHKVVI